MSARSLTAGEIRLARAVFGDSIDYARVAIARAKWAFFQPRHVAMAPRGNIHFHPGGDLYRDDFATAPRSFQGVFIHVMTHVWQHQRGVNLILRRHPFCRYDYVVKPGWRLPRYGIEQQAEIVRHAFLLRQGAVVPGAPHVAAYDAILPFAPGL